MNIKHIASAVLGVGTALAIAATSVLAEVLTVTTNSLNVRKGPGILNDVTYVLRKGDVVEVIRRQGDWAFIVGAKGGEGWVMARYLSSGNTSPPSGGSSTSQVYEAAGTISNSRYKGPGDAQLVITTREKGAAINLSRDDRVSIEYIGVVRSNFEGTVELDVRQFQSSEMGYRTVNASGTCNINVSGGSIRRVYCTARGTGIDHGTSNFTAK
ncbi:MAG: SH3 domain-containing protein [Cyanosarcina radialis HA8281-LM2]|jgi:uncharacterized protein YgiM (DUF1202 family)|nr:SH3 domain-containing protein [Cyanosarcina radialis HA8281-LM2]